MNAITFSKQYLNVYQARAEEFLWLLPHATIRLPAQSVADVQQARHFFSPRLSWHTLKAPTQVIILVILAYAYIIFLRQQSRQRNLRHRKHMSQRQ